MASEREVERLIVRLLGDSKGYQDMLKDAASQTKRSTTRMKGNLGTLERGFRGATKAARALTAAMGPVGLAAAGVGALGGALSTAGLGLFAHQAIGAASDLSESMNAVNVVFGDAAGTIEQFGKQAADTMGLSQVQFNELATTTGSLLQNLGGFSTQQAAQEMGKLGQRAADMASVFNTDVKQAMGAIEAALRGETEPIRRFGVSLDATAIKAKATELGLEKVGKEFTRSAKTTAALALVYEQTNRVAGDFQNTSGELANQTRITQANFAGLQAEIGEKLIPIQAKLMQVVGRLISFFRDPSVQGKIGEFFSNLAKRFQEAMVPVRRFVSNALGFFLNFNKNMGIIFQFLRRNWSNIIKDMINIWITSVSNHIKNLKTGVETIIRIFNVLAGFITGLFKRVFTIDFLRSVVDGLKAVARKILEFGKSAFETLKSQFDLKRILSGEAPKSAIQDFIKQAKSDFEAGAEDLNPIDAIGRVMKEQVGKLRSPIEGFKSSIEDFPELDLKVEGVKLPKFFEDTFKDAGTKAGKTFGGALTKNVAKAVGLTEQDLKRLQGFQFTALEAGSAEAQFQLREQIARFQGGNLLQDEDAKQTSILERIAENTDPRRNTKTIQVAGLQPRFT